MAIKAPTTAERSPVMGMIDACMVVVTTRGLEKKSYAWTTGQKVGVEPQLEKIEPKKLISKGTVLAQKPGRTIMTGTKLTVTDVALAVNMIKLLNGGEFEFEEDGKTVKAYHAPKVGEEFKPEPVDVTVYSAEMKGSTITRYMATTYPACIGEPFAIGAEDDNFTSPTYVFNSTPGEGESAFDVDWVAALPKVTEPA